MSTKTSNNKPECIHCGEPANNVSLTLCNFHIDRLNYWRKVEKEARFEAKCIENRYFIPEYQDWHDDEGRMFQFSGKGNTVKEFVDSVQISEIDQDGGDLHTWDFFQAPHHVQYAILKMMEIEPYDAFGDPTPAY